MRKTYDLPENASFEHMASFLTARGFSKIFSQHIIYLMNSIYLGTLVVEFPLITQSKERGDYSDLALIITNFLMNRRSSSSITKV